MSRFGQRRYALYVKHNMRSAHGSFHQSDANGGGLAEMSERSGWMSRLRTSAGPSGQARGWRKAFV